MDNQQQQDRGQLDRAAIAEMILRERTARDCGRWDEMASYYHPDSSIEVSWLKGSGATFVERSRLQAEKVKKQPDGRQRTNFHDMGTAIVDIVGERATAETFCTLHSFFPLDGVACKMTGFTRLQWRAQKLDGRWLIAGLRCIYVRDLLSPCNPCQVPVIDEAELASYRLSYRFVTYNLARLGLDPMHDLPGEDRPEMVTALRAGELAWLHGQ